MTETAVAEKPVKPSYGESEIQRGLIAVAACSGNTAMAARALAEDEDGFDIEASTLWRWSRKQHVDKYERIRAEVIPRITAQAAEQHMDLALRQSEVSVMALEEIENRLPAMEDKDLINAMGKADIGSGIHTEKAQLLANRPTAIVQRDASEVLRKLQSRGIIDAEVVEEETLSESESSVVAVHGSAVPALAADGKS
jgi:hypothetical protein